MRSYLNLIIVLSFTFFTLSSLSAQSQKEKLQSQYQRILKEISDIEESVKETQEKKLENIALVNSLNAKIRSRENLLNNLKQQIRELKKELDKTTELISSLNSDIERLKSDYAGMVYNTYKYHRSVDPVAFVFSAQSINQAFQRLNYLRKFTSFRTQQASMIQKTISDLSKKEEELIRQKMEQSRLLAAEDAQRGKLESEKNQVAKIIEKFSKDEGRMKKQIADKNEAAEILNKRIQEIIEEEIRLARERAKAAAEAKKSAGSLALTPHELALSTNFSNNKRKLPWPVDRGYIVERFGKQPHPTVKGVYIDANGIGIRTSEDADVRAIFDGTVVSVFYMPSDQNSVIIKHGDYFTVYSNLSIVNVKKGEVISTKQVIGKAFTDESGELTKVNLQIWKGTLKLDPELWLAGFN